MTKINLEMVIKPLDLKKEAYNTLRTNIMFCGKEMKVIILTSCMEKSNEAFHLAVSFAECGKKTLFIDADFRGTSLMKRYELGEINDGLAGYILGQKEQKDIILTTNIKNMEIIFSGKEVTNISEILESNRFRSLILDLRDRYDYVIVDTPSLYSVIDSAIIAKYCDGAVLIIESNKVSDRIAKKVKRQLEKTECKIIGALLTNIKIKKSYNKY